MEILYVILFLSFLGLIPAQKTESSQPFCKKLPKLGELSFGTRINKTYLQFINLSLMECARKCMRRKRCKSINYSKQLSFCELNYEKDGTRHSPEESNVFVHSDISGWSEDLIGECKGHNCALNEKCIGSRECVKSDCGPAPDPPKNAIVLNAGHHEVGNGFYYGCKDGYAMWGSNNANAQDNVIPVKCMQNGEWDSPLFKCEETLKFENHWYYFSTERMSWWNAQSFCRSMKSHLVKVDSQAEFDWLIKELEKKSIDSWTGGNDIVNEGTWVWEVDNSNIIWQNWYKGQPDNANEKDCISLIRSWTGWNDAHCKNNKNFICEQ